VLLGRDAVLRQLVSGLSAVQPAGSRQDGMHTRLVIPHTHFYLVAVAVVVVAAAAVVVVA
jgi:hypothetical protein